jgi:hypothetical protein
VDKSKIVREILVKLEADLEVLVASAKAAHTAATHEESKAEDKYDTRGLEASYLAGAQSKRALEIQGMIQDYRKIEMHDFGPDSTAAVTALVEAESEGRRSLYFLARRGGGYGVRVDGREVNVISVTSPLGEELVGRGVGEEFEVTLANGTRRDYEIVSLS